MQRRSPMKDPALISTPHVIRLRVPPGADSPRQQRRPRLLILAIAVVAAAVLLLLEAPQTALAYTAPEDLAALTVLRDANTARSPAWARSLEHWTCPTDPNDSDAACDPCSKDWSGNWEFIHCRGSEGPYGEGSTGSYDGHVTTVHITDQKLDGPPPRELCGLSYLRELDLDGSSFNGPFPDWILSCLPRLQELDLSYNRITGSIPAAIASKKLLQEFKMEYNELIGTIPGALGNIPNLRVLRLEHNHLTGTLPQELSKLSGVLNGLELADNNLRGDLSALSTARPMYVTLSDNPGLCGMVPAGVRFAHGYNPTNTRLGQPCD